MDWRGSDVLHGHDCNAEVWLAVVSEDLIRESELLR